MRVTSKVVPSISGNIGSIHLNNPSALNSLDVDMVRYVNDIFHSFTSSSPHKGLGQETSSSKRLKAIIITSNNEKRKAFCAGGDMKRIYMAALGLNQNSRDVEAFKMNQHGYGYRGLETADFLAEEYQMNYTMAQNTCRLYDEQEIPQISIWDGIVMGGGFGISIHGKYRIATENSLFAMPETNIGFYPDVGATFILPKLKSGIGNYLALTGARLKADDLLFSGLATHYVPSHKIEALIQDLIKTSNDIKDRDVAKDVLSSYHDSSSINLEQCFLATNQCHIEEAFSNKQTIEEILEVLNTSETEFAKSTIETMNKMSPTAMKVTLKSMIEGKRLNDIGESLKMEFRMGQVSVRKEKDFYEGIRAALVDKDRNPKWNPSSIVEVTDDIVDQYFQDLGENELKLVDPHASSSKL